ncbi:putative RNA-directed DNA polymerase from transposon BS [Trichonephila clavipes]|uniref:Putative RNA-directed DNA polymerase from transposon BS n=1 Tax=Trichonephila clavipes TaxID=2585209 RepID=A0A8X6RGY3_TRICX|nr:putative RNA-directed DNA polymerase from transposon BS [Trichonephila clavipes]
MSRKFLFAIFKVLQGIEKPKLVKKMRSGDLLVETKSSIQSNSYLSAKTFLDSPLLVIPHKSLNSSRGVISEPGLLRTSEGKILE